MRWLGTWLSNLSGPKLAGLVVAGIGLISGVLALFGVTGNVRVGVAIVGILVLGAAVLLVVQQLRATPRMQVGSLSEAIRQWVAESPRMDCIFSAGDQLRQVLDSGLFRGEGIFLRPGFTIRLAVRRREAADVARVVENLERISERLSGIGVGFESRQTPWDTFMIGGALFNESCAAVKFYYRQRGRTHSLSDNYILVDRRRGGYEEALYRALHSAFDSLWTP